MTDHLHRPGALRFKLKTQLENDVRDDELTMRNLCIDMIFDAGHEDGLMNTVHSAAKVLGTPQHVLDSLMIWAGFEPDGVEPINNN
jgi:hypothetical protein